MAEEIHNQPLVPPRNISEIVKEGVLPDFYVNGFATGYSASEIHLLFNEHGKNVALIQMSFPAAKSLAKALGNILKNYEDKVGESVSDLEQLQQKILVKK